MKEPHIWLFSVLSGTLLFRFPLNSISYFSGFFKKLLSQQKTPLLLLTTIDPYG